MTSPNRVSPPDQGIDMNVCFRLTLVLSMLSPAINALELNECKLQYPIVLSHHFGLRTICPDSWTPDECMTREAENLQKK